MEYEERQMIKINDNGIEKDIEVISLIPSKINNKKYVVYTFDKEIGDKVNINIGILRSKDNISYLESVEDDNELNYVYSLIDEIVKED